MTPNNEDRALQTSGQQSTQTLPDRIRATGNRSIAKLRLDRKDELLGIIADLVIDVVTFHNVARNMNPAQITQFARALAETNEYYYLNPGELKTCFDRGCAGNYGQVYERLDGAILYDWIKKYDQERLVEVKRRNQEDMDRNNIYDIFHNETMHKVLTEVHDKLKHKEQPAPTEYKPREKHPIEVQIESEWDAEIKKGNVVYTGGMRMIDVNGVPMTYTEFYNHRFIQMTEE